MLNTGGVPGDAPASAACARAASSSTASASTLGANIPGRGLGLVEVMGWTPSLSVLRRSGQDNGAQSRVVLLHAGRGLQLVEQRADPALALGLEPCLLHGVAHVRERLRLLRLHREHLED